MMSQIVMSIFSSPGPSEPGTDSSFLETFVPRVWMYLSSKLSSTNRRMRDVFPTAASPTRQVFTFIRLASMKLRLTGPHTRGCEFNRCGNVINPDTPGRQCGRKDAPTVGGAGQAVRRNAKGTYAAVPFWRRGKPMCDEYDDERM